MTRRRELPRLFWISPGEGVHDALLRRLTSAVRGGLRAFQLREKASFARDLAAAIPAIRRILPSGEGLVLVNDRIDVAQVTAADGVHLGGGSLDVASARTLLGATSYVGRSVHDERELAEAVTGGADFVFASPVFPVRKRGAPPGAPLGLVGLQRLVAASSVPVFALGGVTLENVAEVKGTGAHGIAVMRSIANASDPRAFVAAMVEALG